MAEQLGWTVVSMKNDWTTMYGKLDASQSVRLRGSARFFPDAVRKTFSSQARS